jgi:hypothetical protein
MPRAQKSRSSGSSGGRHDMDRRGRRCRRAAG